MTLAPLFCDNMVLQAGEGTGVYGTADPGQTVTVTLNRQTRQAVAGADGRWLVRLDLPEAGGPHELSVSAGHEQKVFRNVLIGDVWVCGGQSNMEFNLSLANNAQAEAAAAHHPGIRLFTVAQRTSIEPQEQITGKWNVCSPETAPTFSAVGYFFGREVHRRTGRPIGLISSNWGGTPAEAWVSRAALASARGLGHLVKQRDECIQMPTAEYDAYQGRVQQWVELENRRQADEKAGLPPTIKPGDFPWPPPPGPTSPMTPTLLYNGMIHPLVRFGIRGALWYQGESNADRAIEYRTLLPMLIRNWHNAWGRGDFPFYIVQLANYGPVQEQPGDSQWAELREAQAMTAANAPNCGLATAVDVGDAVDIHPRNKQDVGKRLALVALAQTYGQDVVHAGPSLASHIASDGVVRMRFSNVPGGISGGVGARLAGFSIAGADRAWHWADAVVESGDTVVASSPNVPKPVAVRYAWQDNPTISLRNAAGLPAPPLRTDDWVREGAR
jgi:sialate O-acetylesterase